MSITELVMPIYLLQSTSGCAGCAGDKNFDWAFRRQLLSHEVSSQGCISCGLRNRGGHFEVLP
jgi:hypothetical protein